MKIKRVYRYVYLVMFVLLSVQHVHGVPIKHEDHTENTPKLANKIKFGLGVGLGVSILNPSGKSEGNISEDSSSVEGKVSFPVEGYGEYLFDSVGLRLSLKHASKGTREKDKILENYIERTMALNYFMVAPMLRWYPGKAKQFCIFIGPRLGYLYSAKYKEKVKGRETLNVNLLKNSLQDAKMRRWDWSITFGWDYETKKGFIWGALFSADVSLSKILKFEKSQEGEEVNFRNLYGQVLYIGYNFAKLL